MVKRDVRTQRIKDQVNVNHCCLPFDQWYGSFSAIGRMLKLFVIKEILPEVELTQSWKICCVELMYQYL